MDMRALLAGRTRRDAGMAPLLEIRSPVAAGYRCGAEVCGSGCSGQCNNLRPSWMPAAASSATGTKCHTAGGRRRCSEQTRCVPSAPSRRRGERGQQPGPSRSQRGGATYEGPDQDARHEPEQGDVHAAMGRRRRPPHPRVLGLGNDGGKEPRRPGGDCDNGSQRVAGAVRAGHADDQGAAAAERAPSRAAGRPARGTTPSASTRRGRAAPRPTRRRRRDRVPSPGPSREAYGGRRQRAHGRGVADQPVDQLMLHATTHPVARAAHDRRGAP